MKQKQIFILVFIIFIAFTLRVHLLGNQELRGDEGFSWNYVQDPIQDIVPRIIHEGDPQPPLHYWLLWIWVKLTGDSELAMRAWSTMLSMLLVPLTYQVARKLWNNNSSIGIITASIMAIHPQQIWLAQDVRNMYQLALTPLLIATLTLPKIIQTSPYVSFQISRKKGISLIDNLKWSFSKSTFLTITSYITCGALAIYSHYYALFFLVAHSVYVVVHTKNLKNSLRWIFSGVAIGAIFTPWVIAILPVYLQGQLADPTSFSILKYSTAIFSDLTAGPTFPEEQKIFGIIGFAILSFITLNTRTKNSIYPFAALLIPFIGIYAVANQRSTFNSFYYVFATPAAYLIAAVALQKIFTIQKQIGASIMIIIVFFFCIGLQNNYSSLDYSKTRGMRQVAAHIAESVQPGDIYLANFPDPVQNYYIRHLQIDHQMQPTRADFNPAQVNAELQKISKDRRLWHVPIHASMWDQNAYVQNQLNQMAIIAEDNIFYKMRLTLYLPLTATTPLDVQFENGIQLIGLYYSPHRLTLLWTTIVLPTKNYTVFVHYLTYDGFNTLGYDTPTSPPTMLWKIGETIIDSRVIPIPPDMPSGEYKIDIGLYDETGKRLVIKESGEDHLLLPIKVKVP